MLLLFWGKSCKRAVFIVLHINEEKLNLSSVAPQSACSDHVRAMKSHVEATPPGSLSQFVNPSSRLPAARAEVEVSVLASLCPLQCSTDK